jgi:hypothetical protein
MSVKSGFELLLLYPNAARVRAQLPFESPEVTLQLIDALFEREHVIAGWVVHAFEHFGDLRNLGP